MNEQISFASVYSSWVVMLNEKLLIGHDDCGSFAGMPTGFLANLVGQKFGYLVVLSRTVGESRYRKWLCQCRCGKKTTVSTAKLNSGWTKSCGCLQLERASQINSTHGLSGTVEYKIWEWLKTRCHTASSSNYKNYGGRGIKVCKRWRTSFENFLMDVGHRPSPKHQIDRIDNDGDYEPGNVRWATRDEQARNRRNTRNITFRGETLCLEDWAARIGVNHSTLHNRLGKWSLKKALTTPPRRDARRK